MTTDLSKVVEVMESDAPESEKLFVISENLSSLFHYTFEGNVPTDFQKFEAMIFASFWTLKMLAVRKSKLFNEANSNFPGELVQRASPNVMIKIFDTNEFPDFFVKRFKFYISETAKMKLDGYDFTPIISKLYLSPLSPTDETTPQISPFQYLKISGTFSLALKHYDEAINKILNLMQV